MDPIDSADVEGPVSVAVSQCVPESTFAPIPTSVSAPPASPGRRECEVETSEERSRIIKRPRSEGIVEGGLSLTPVPQPSSSAPWRPNFQLGPERLLLVEDRVLRGMDPLVLQVLGNACTLPLDAAQLKALDDVTLFLSSIQSSLASVQKGYTILERFQNVRSTIVKLEAEKKELQGAVYSGDQKIKRLQDINYGWKLRMEKFVAEKSRLEADTEAEKKKSAELEVCLEKLKNEFTAKLQDEAQRAAELERQRDEAVMKSQAEAGRAANFEKQKDDAEDKLESAVRTALQEGVDEATQRYDDQFASVKTKN